MPISREALLRFLDAAPRVSGHREAHGILPEPSGNAGKNQAHPDVDLSTFDFAARNASGAKPATECGTETDYLNLLMGTAGTDEAERLLDHASTCPRCGQLLASSLSALDGNPSQEEATAIAALAATRQDWQENLVRQLAATPVRKHTVDGRQSPAQFSGKTESVWGSRWRWVSGAIAAVLIAAVALFLWQRRTSDPELQLATAYSQGRTLELRIPDATFAQSIGGSHTRGTTADREPSALLEARATLARELERSPQNPHWLQLQARADLLAERYDPAVDVLDRLLATSPVTAELLVDAASAYFQRGLVSGNQLDRSTALDYLRRADELAPTDPVVLFNEAIVMEDRGQMMNAVEVWNRYITVERDPQWAAEGKRKLTVLEQTLNRLKTHESRIQKMLSSPSEMNALASDASRIALFDEELSTMKLAELFSAAYPITDQGGADHAGKDQARGSPCNESCAAARRLLKTISTSLEQQHRDFWLSDLLAPPLNTLPAPVAILYAKALQLMGKAVNQGISGDLQKVEQQASESEALFEEIAASAHSTPVLVKAANVGRRRAAVEHLVTMQRLVDFRTCRLFAQQLEHWPGSSLDRGRYPWMESVLMVTEKTCDDTPETRQAGRERLQKAMQLAESSRYPLLQGRIQMRATADADLTGDTETLEKLALAVLHNLTPLDVPPWRIVNTLNPICFAEQDTPRAHMAEGCFRELEGWLQLGGNRELGTINHLLLARAEIRIGAMQEFNRQLKLAYTNAPTRDPAGNGGTHFSQSELMIAQVMLQRGDLDDARSFLNRAQPELAHESDSLAQRNYAAASGQLELSLQHFDKASALLESEIFASEGRNVRGKDNAFVAEYAAEDHDLYAELAAVWLAQGRSPESVLALWERFRLRSHGLPIRPCAGAALDCEQPQLFTSLRQLDNSLLVGQIVLLDRVLVYRADRDGVTWTQKSQRRQDVLDAAQRLERAVSFPVTTQATTNELGVGLANVLLPPLPASLTFDASLLLESDPLIENLSWPVLPAPAGPLGIAYPLTEIRTILAPETPAAGSNSSKLGHEGPGSSLVVAASVAGEGEPPLPETLVEAANVKRYLLAPKLLLGRQATTGGVASQLASATVWHFAGHARQSGSGTELLLAPEADDIKPWIDGAFLRNHPPQRCRLAILSACATGQREAAWNHPLQDIVETLGSLGVPEIVATRWQIDSEATVPFMDNLYRNLAKGKSVAMALSNARRVQSENSLYKNPYYWGAYYLSGRETPATRGKLYASFYKEDESRPETAQAGLGR